MWRIGINPSPTPFSPRPLSPHTVKPPSVIKVFPSKTPKPKPSHPLLRKASKSSTHRSSHTQSPKHKLQFQKNLIPSINNLLDGSSTKIFKTEPGAQNTNIFYLKNHENTQEVMNKNIKEYLEEYYKKKFEGEQKREPRKELVSVGVQTDCCQYFDPNEQPPLSYKIDKIWKESVSSKGTKVSTESGGEEGEIVVLNRRISELERVIETYQIKLIDLTNQHNTLRKNVNAKLRSYKVEMGEIIGLIGRRLEENVSVVQEMYQKNNDLLTRAKNFKPDLKNNPEEYLHSIMSKISEIKNINTPKARDKQTPTPNNKQTK